MKNVLALTIALVLGTSGAAIAGMQGQGAAPDAKKPEYKEPNSGSVVSSGSSKTSRPCIGTEMAASANRSTEHNKRFYRQTALEVVIAR